MGMFLSNALLTAAHNDQYPVYKVPSYSTAYRSGWGLLLSFTSRSLQKEKFNKSIRKILNEKKFNAVYNFQFFFLRLYQSTVLQSAILGCNGCSFQVLVLYFLIFMFFKIYSILDLASFRCWGIMHIPISHTVSTALFKFSLGIKTFLLF